MDRFYLRILTLLLPISSLIGNINKYIESWPEKYTSKLLVRDWACQKDLLDSGCHSDYLNPIFASFLPKDKISIILEIGSRDAIDALCLSEYFKAHVYSFECSPEALLVCKHNIGSNPNVTLVPLAVWNETGPTSFFPIVTAGEEPLIGLSSIFKLDPTGPVQATQKQKEVTVQATRLDDWMEKENIEQIDLACIDVQGGTLQVLQGLGNKLSRIKYIIAEVEYQQYYIGQVLYPAVEAHLRSYGFTPYAQMFHTGIYKGVADALFIRNDLIIPGITQKVGFYK